MSDTETTTKSADATIATAAVVPFTPTRKFGRCLVVADRAHVWVGDVDQDDEYLRITNARAVRRWGTSEGLNQLAAQGPLPSTRLDAAADLLVSRRAVIAVIPCEAGKWAA